jgi:uncharacterized RDD family membrane protein YckC
MHLGNLPPKLVHMENETIMATPGARFGSYLMEYLLLIVTLGIGWLVWSLVVWKNGTTPGHQVLKQVIVDEKTKQPLSWGRMALREVLFKGLVGAFLAIISFGVFFVVDSLFVTRDDRRTIHDRMSGSLVIQG